MESWGPLRQFGEDLGEVRGFQEVNLGIDFNAANKSQTSGFLWKQVILKKPYMALWGKSTTGNALP